MRKLRTRALPFAVAALVAGCGGDNPAGPGNGSGPAGLSFENFQPAELVIGQIDLTSGAADAGGSPNAVGLRLPFSPGGGSLYIADPYNNRVLGFAGFPASDGAAAMFVLGQPDFTTNTPGSTKGDLNFPEECVVDGGRLFVADAGMRRVLIWNSLPTAHVPADVSVPVPFFAATDRSAARSAPPRPVRIAVGGGRLFVADNLNNRVLIWTTIPATDGIQADLVIGQPDFASFAPGTSASLMASPQAVWTDGTRLAVSDAGNRRVLIWNSIPTTNGAPADLVLGQPDFDTANTGGVTAIAFECPAGMASDGRSLFVADCQLNRVLMFTPFPRQNDVAATTVLGQSDFAHSASNDGNQDDQPDGQVTARTLYGPNGVGVFGDRLLVADSGNNRVLVFAASR